MEGWGEKTRGKCKEIFWFLHTRVRERVRGALSRSTTQSERTRQFQVTTRSARAKWVRAKVNTSPHKNYKVIFMRMVRKANYFAFRRDLKVAVIFFHQKKYTRQGSKNLFATANKLFMTKSLTLRLLLAAVVFIFRNY